MSLAKRVLLPGFREDVLSLMKSADLFVMSSVTEGLGSAVLDAMAMGLAVVGTTAGGIPEAVVPDVTGELVPPSDAKPLAAAIVKLLKDPDLRRNYGDAGRHHVAGEFRRRQTRRRNPRVLPALRPGMIGVRPRNSPRPGDDGGRTDSRCSFSDRNRSI